MSWSIKNMLNNRSPAQAVAETVREATDELVNALTNEEEVTVEEWIWVTGYKGMDKNMQCRNNFQYEIGHRYDMPEDSVIEACSGGFHLCPSLQDVFGYVKIGEENRFFEVRALVRKSDADRCGEWEYIRDHYGAPIRKYRRDKLAAKSIEIIRELTMDEILEPFGYHEWDEGYKKMALTTNVEVAKNTMRFDTLVDLGYSRPFAQYLIDSNKYTVAKAVGSQPDLSMDVKCWMIMMEKGK